jgi:hypothetical protein
LTDTRLDVLAAEMRLLDREGTLKQFFFLLRFAQNAKRVAEIDYDRSEIWMRKPKRCLSDITIVSCCTNDL